MAPAVFESFAVEIQSRLTTRGSGFQDAALLHLTQLLDVVATPHFGLSLLHSGVFGPDLSDEVFKALVLLSFMLFDEVDVPGWVLKDVEVPDGGVLVEVDLVDDLLEFVVLGLLLETSGLDDLFLLLEV